MKETFDYWRERSAESLSMANSTRQALAKLEAGGASMEAFNLARKNYAAEINHLEERAAKQADLASQGAPF